MHTYRQLNTYIDKKMSLADRRLLALRNDGIADHIPIICDEMARFLMAQLAIIAPQSILEIGTAIGYSGSLMLLNSHAQLTTIELNDAHYKRATQTFAKLGLSARVCQHAGDAADILNDLVKTQSRYDFIFIDAAKGHYLDYFKSCEALLADSGVIIADNVLFKGYVTGTPYPRRQRTIVGRMQDFIDYVTHHRGFTSSLLSVGDGVLLAVRTT